MFKIFLKSFYILEHLSNRPFFSLPRFDWKFIVFKFYLTKNLHFVLVALKRSGHILPQVVTHFLPLLILSLPSLNLASSLCSSCVARSGGRSSAARILLAHNNNVQNCSSNNNIDSIPVVNLKAFDYWPSPLLSAKS